MYNLLKLFGSFLSHQLCMSKRYDPAGKRLNLNNLYNDDGKDLFIWNCSACWGHFAAVLVTSSQMLTGTCAINGLIKTRRFCRFEESRYPAGFEPSQRHEGCRPDHFREHCWGLYWVQISPPSVKKWHGIDGGGDNQHMHTASLLFWLCLLFVCFQLQSLDLGDNRIYNLGELEAMAPQVPHLTQLNLENNQVEKTWPSALHGWQWLDSVLNFYGQLSAFWKVWPYRSQEVCTAYSYKWGVLFSVSSSVEERELPVPHTEAETRGSATRWESIVWQVFWWEVLCQVKNKSKVVVAGWQCSLVSAGRVTVLVYSRIPENVCHAEGREMQLVKMYGAAGGRGGQWEEDHSWIGCFDALGHSFHLVHCMRVADVSA